MSLRITLYNKIKEQGYISYAQLCQICLEEGYKVDTGRRRIDDFTNVEPVFATSKRGTKYVSKWKLKELTTNKLF